LDQPLFLFPSLGEAVPIGWFIRREDDISGLSGLEFIMEMEIKGFLDGSNNHGLGTCEGPGRVKQKSILKI
jgi:hypothetical protein